MNYRRFYRERERRRIVAALQAGASLIVLGECGSGKTVLADAIAKELRALGFPVAMMIPATEKTVLTRVCNQFDIPTQSIEGKGLTVSQMKEAIARFISSQPVFFIVDNADKTASQVKLWLSELHDLGQPLLLLVLKRPNINVFIKAPTIELQPLGYRQIREIMHETSHRLGAEFSPYQFAYLQQRVGGNPMLARRVVWEEFLGVDETEPDHTRWFNGLPILMAVAMLATLVRLVGRGTSDRTLLLLGAILTIALGIFRLVAYSLEKKTKGVGR